MAPDVLRILKDIPLSFPSSFEIKRFSQGLFISEPYDPDKWSLTVEPVEVSGDPIKTRVVFPSWHRENGQKVGQEGSGYILYVDEVGRYGCSLRVKEYCDLNYEKKYILGGFKDVLSLDSQNRLISLKNREISRTDFLTGVVLCPINQGILFVSADIVRVEAARPLFTQRIR